ncbi:MAG: YncE family protein [Mycobacterium sp.]
MRAVCGLLMAVAALSGCSSNPADAPPPTIEPAHAAASPPATTAPAGQVIPLGGHPDAALFDHGTSTLAVLTPGAPGTGAPEKSAALTVLAGGGLPRTVPLPGPATAICGDDRGTLFASTRGGFFTVDLRTGTATRTAVSGRTDTDFTAIAQRSDGRLVLGTADGKVDTLAADMTVSATATIFARVDAIVTQGDTAVVLDRAQTSVTALNPQGTPQLALRAGQGATTIAADPAGRVLVADTRAGQLLVFSADPLIERQAAPAGDSPYGLAGSATLVWVSQTATNTVVGYDLSTGIPVEKVRYPTVQQPNSLAFDDASGTLYVVSGSGAGVQVIRNAGAAR